MKSHIARIGHVVLALLVSVNAFAADVPLTNWTVPAYTHSSRGSSGGLTTMTDISEAVAFVAVTPCRLVDTRQAGFPAGYGPPSLTGGVPRNFDLNNQPNCPGFPGGVEAYSLNITVTNTQGPGFILIYPQGGAQPSVSTVNYVGGQTIANAAIVPSGTGGGVTVIAGVSGTDLIIDINGYFASTLNDGRYHEVRGSFAAGGVIFGENSNNAAFSSGVRGVYSGTGAGFGLQGQSSSTLSGAGGVLGYSGARSNTSGFFHTGVRGESNTGNGVLGLIPGTSTGFAVAGFSYNGDTQLLAGRLGDEGSNLGVSYAGGLGGTGTKNFIEPHPRDASKMIRYVSLEGPEAGTYFRGKGRFLNGIAEISVPESFRMVTDPEGLSIQVTPIGQMATVAVESIGLDRIVVRGSRNVEFFYTVNGVRTAYKNYEIVTENNFFVPESANAGIPGSLSPIEKQRLIDNGTFNPDGTVNLETARRLGWEQKWAERERPTPQPVEP